MTKVNEAGADEKELDGAEGADEKDNEGDKGDDGAAGKTKPPIVETAEAKRARLKRQLKKVEQELGITEEEAEAAAAKKPDIKSFKLGYAEKAYLISSGIKDKDEQDLAAEMVRNTGKSLEDVVDSKYYQAELKDIRANKESRMASDAASGSRKGAPSARDTVDYWLGRNDLPPAHMVQLRRDVVNARAKNDRNQGTFTSNNVVGGR